MRYRGLPTCGRTCLHRLTRVALPLAWLAFSGATARAQVQLVSSIYTVAGTGIAGFSGDGGAATSAKVSSPIGIAFDSSGNIYFTDTANNRVRKIVPTTGIITTVAGTGTAGSTGLGGAATSALLSGPTGILVDPSGNVLIADSTNNRVLKITASTGSSRL